MTNPQLTENLLAVIRSLPADVRRWLLRQLEQDSSELSNGALAEPLRHRAGRLPLHGWACCQASAGLGDHHE